MSREIKDSDLKIRLHHPKVVGFSVKQTTAVSVKHKPTGLKAKADSGRSQHKSKAICLAMLRAGLEAMS